ncbi:MAG: hypothetical protein JWN04_2248 [Myxococcaceae bacterium]|nr:hypothetical protein [Myxococcaceae bacterium]
MANASITVRNLRFTLDDDVPKYWFGGQRSISMLLDHLSIIFPPGESFFMASVRAFESQITDPQLREDVRSFHAQEALHGREHVRYNERLRKLGYPVDGIDASARRILWLTTRVLSRRGQLAVTAALEHFTALLAQVALPSDSFLNQAHPEMSALWRWHAAEENEHAAVAFDVLQTVSGSYPLRVGIMALTTVFFLEKVLEHQIRMMWRDRCLFSGKQWAALYKFLFRDPAIVNKVFRPYLAYYRRNFHPHQIESGQLLEDWRAEFAVDERYRRSVFAPKRTVASGVTAP